uniref:F-box domain-containing protein n=1 Tax=Dunaliella tertiolecta TaxID=3047 RepID=A0A7S3QU36_DUNTE
MPPPQEDRLSSLPSDIHALIWAHLPSPDQQSLYNALPAFRSNAIHAQIKKLEISARGAGFFLLRRKMFERLCKFPTAADLQELSLVHGSHPEDLIAFLKQACIKKNEMMRGVKRVHLQGWDMNAKIGCDCGLCSHGQPDMNFEVASALLCTCPMLRELSLNKCEMSHDMFCTPLLRNLRKLEILDMCYLDGASINPVDSVAQLTQLQELRLCWDDSIEMVDIGPLSHLQQLTRLTVGTGFIEVLGVEAVMASCLKLSYLDFTFEDCSFFLGPPDKDDLFLREKATFSACLGLEHNPLELILNAFQMCPSHLNAVLKLPAIQPGRTQLGCVCLALASEDEIGSTEAISQAAAILEASAHALHLLPQGQSADELAQERLRLSGLPSPVMTIDRANLTFDGSLLESPKSWLPSLAPLQPSLRGLCLHSIEIGLEDVRALTQALPNLWGLEISGGHMLPGAVSALVSGLPKLRKLALCGGVARVSDVCQACIAAQGATHPWPLHFHVRHMLDEDQKGNWDGISVEESVQPGGRVELTQVPKPVRPLRRSARLRSQK